MNDKLKQVVVVWVAIYPAVTILMTILGESLIALPIYVRTLLLTIILVPLMVCFLVPFWTSIIDGLMEKIKIATNENADNYDSDVHAPSSHGI